MHTFSETGAGVPAFLAKLWRLVDDSETDNLICWSKDGRSFIIQNQAQFARELLPLNYKHNNMASFIRQLNMYGFHKITSIDNGGLKFDRDEMEFSHPCFKRNCPYLLEHIKRKIANTKSLDDKAAAAIKPEAVSKVLQDVKAMRGRQDSLDSRFSVMKQENEALWREIASLRQKHAKQQQIVNKLIQFLITIVQPSRNMTSVKRHMQLMINDTPENAKLRTSSESGSDSGPVIHELGEELLDEVTDSDVELIDDPNSPYVKLTTGQHQNNDNDSEMERPLSNLMSPQHYDYSNQSVEDVLASVGVKKAVPANGGGGGVTNTNTAASSIIQSVNPDGSKIVYHVTEVPDAIRSQEESGPGVGAGTGAAVAAVSAFNLSDEHDNNVLTTPLVREQMARSQMLKQKNKQRRKQDAAAGVSTLLANTPAKTQRRLTTATVTSSSANAPLQIQVKAEQEIDPMLFLNAFAENRGNSPASLISPNLSEDSRQSASNANTAAAGPMRNDRTASAATARNAMSAATDLYNSNDFIASDMPANIFEDSSLISGDNFDDDNFKLLEQQQYGRSTASSGKFSSFLAGNNNNINNNNANGASTSAAAAAAAAASSSSSAGGTNASISTTASGGASTSSGLSVNRGKNGSSNNLTLAKFKNGSTSGVAAATAHPDDVHGHLDNVQDELETLKDLLRSDSYSLDANTLMGSGGTTTPTAINSNRIYLSQALDGDFFNKLFNDSDILGAYGLNLPTDGSNDRKGSELMTYQPIYDFSDIIDINNKNELDAEREAAASSGATPSSRQLQTQSSTLNTPRHE